ncbi:MAG: 5-oxoprolinase subunit PxpA [Anaerolineales bacterium]|nr:MAG: 5-oxoprolinase subunit PxpA [Anaerolineales bacterium]
MNIDLNCDMGENIGNDELIMPFITSANIACGYHAGNAKTMRDTVRLAKKFGVKIGAHPSWLDVEGFGRREMNLPLEEVEALILDQVSALAAIAEAEGMALTHVKPHGALYNQAARERPLAQAVARAVKNFNGELTLVGLAGSRLVEAGVEVGLKVANEGFPDRNYNPDGTLVSRKEPHAIIESPEDVATHAMELIRDGVLFEGRRVRVDTLCLHGDHPRVVENARLMREVLQG